MLINQLGRFVAETRYGDLPERVIDLAKLRILDLLGSALVGYQLGHYRPLLRILGGKGEATVWGEGKKYPLRDAVLLNSFMAHSSYLEDGSRFTGGHPSSVVIPAALSFGETRKSTGRDLILSVAVGYDLFLRLGKAIYPSTVERGFQSTAVLGAVSSAAACSSLLHLSRDQCKDALAIACNLGVGLKEALKTPGSQPIQVGRSCENGLLSTLFAANGVPGSDSILEKGFFKAFADSLNESEILSELGIQFRIQETYVKIHGGCRGNHAPIDVIQNLIRERKILLEEIKEIRVKVDSVTSAANIENPQNGGQAQMSIPFSIAIALLEGNASIHQFSDEKLNDPAVRSMMNKILIEVDKNMDNQYPDKRGAYGEILLEDGRGFSGSVEIARGEPEVPVSPNEIEEKFALLTHDILGRKTEKVRDQVRVLEELEDVGELVKGLRGSCKTSI
jgi:2-methylcitrate dehydratase PrpD